jgi:uracil-DNA glycosylase
VTTQQLGVYRGSSMLDEAKRELMRELVRKRRVGWLPDGCYRLGDARLNNGYWDEDDFVVPWSKLACNYSAKIMLIAQDWDSLENLSAPLTAKRERIKLVGRNEKLLTNTRIDGLLDQYFGLRWQDIFATDVFPFVKPGHMRGDLRWDDLVRCALEFARPQIDIIKPLVVICLGRSTTFRAIAKAMNSRVTAVDDDNPLGPIHYDGTEIYGVTHPGGRGNGWLKRIEMEWAFLANRLRELETMHTS